MQEEAKMLRPWREKCISSLHPGDMTEVGAWLDKEMCAILIVRMRAPLLNLAIGYG